MEIKWKSYSALTKDELYALLNLRQQVFVVEQDCPFVDADFKDKDGKIYDLDVFMHGKTVEDLAFRKFHVHKEEGLPRYGWKEEEGVWKRVLPELEKKKE